MRVLSVTNTNNKISFRGRVSRNVLELTKNMSESWLDTAANRKYKALPIINTFLDASERVNNVLLNLSTIMERFCQGCELNFAKSAKNGKYRFFIEHKDSSYKTICGDVEFSPKLNKYTDVNELENLEVKVSKLNPYKENSHFIIQRKPDSKSPMLDSEFIPDEDYMFLEDKLIKKEYNEAAMEDVEEFLEAAKEEGLIDG